ncbi:MAG TPA: glutamate-cysteine ligase family protein, partial [Kiloniellaceae bacterium]|nr:glutamate-cysteine ligase family protein [Kiloniellaceae bacterium]
VDHVLDVPMYFVYRDGKYIDASGQSFRDFMDGRLPALPGERPGIGDWADHLSTLFPEVRMKRFLEMRGADGGPWKSLCALPAFWVGLLYDQTALDAAWDLVKDWTLEEHQYLRDSVPTQALQTPFRGRKLNAVAARAVEIADAGLKARARLDGQGDNESHFLALLHSRVEREKCPAEYLLEDFHGRWQGSIDPVFTECAY